MLLGELLEDFEAELRTQNVPVDRLLRPPVPPKAVRAHFAQLGLDAPDEAVTLFGWRDGVEAGLGLALPVFELASLEGVVSRYQRSRLGLGEWDWNPHWVQVMGGKYGLAIRCDDQPDRSPLVRSVEDAAGSQDWQTDYQVLSLCTPVTWWIDAMRRGWYRYNPAARAWDRSGPSPFPLAIDIYNMT